MSHIHQYQVNYLGQLVCACGDKMQDFVLTGDDLAVHKGHKRQLLEALNTGGWTSRDSLVAAVGTKNFTARISNLREAGYIITCQREGKDGGTFYKLEGKVDHSTVDPRVCPNCGHRF